MIVFEQWQRQVARRQRQLDQASRFIRANLEERSGHHPPATAHIDGTAVTYTGPWDEWVEAGVEVAYTSRTGMVLVTVSGSLYCTHSLGVLGYGIDTYEGQTTQGVINDRRVPFSENDRLKGGKFSKVHSVVPGVEHTYRALLWGEIIPPAFTNDIILTDVGLTVKEMG